MRPSLHQSIHLWTLTPIHIQEVAESVDEFLTLASTKYAIKSYLGPPPEFDVKQQYGPFACEVSQSPWIDRTSVCFCVGWFGLMCGGHSASLFA